VKPATILTAAVAACLSFGPGRAAQADRSKLLQVRQINTAPRLIGCSRDLESCDGATSVRTGLVVIDLESHYLQRGPLSLVAMFQASAQPKDALLASQVIVGGGPRLTLEHSWLQVGLGLAGSQVARGPKTLPVTSLLGMGAPAAMVGVGTLVTALDVPLQLSLDIGSNLGVFRDDQFGDTYQVTANVVAIGL
jgi:hypothetical protein